MLAPGLLCFRGWSHTGNLLYGVAGGVAVGGCFFLGRRLVLSLFSAEPSLAGM